MAGPVGSSYDRDLTTSSYYKFIEAMWSAEDDKVRKELKKCAEEGVGGVRDYLRDGYSIVLPASASVHIVDIQNNDTYKAKDEGIADWYYLILPPNPQRHPGSDNYRETQAWSEALHAAVDDSYGM